LPVFRPGSKSRGGIDGPDLDPDTSLDHIEVVIEMQSPQRPVRRKTLSAEWTFLLDVQHQQKVTLFFAVGKSTRERATKPDHLCPMDWTMVVERGQSPANGRTKVDASKEI
jgi:hypothetical protein